ncbi:hypothetical protein Tco_0512127 [Tanacetum coccineum]
MCCDDAYRSRLAIPPWRGVTHHIELTDYVPTPPHDSPLPRGYTPGSDEGRMKLTELIALCTKLSKQVLDLEKDKDAQAVEILKLKKQVKKLERQCNSSTSYSKKRIYKQVQSFDTNFVEEDVSKQGMKNSEAQEKRGSDDTKVVKGSGDTEVLDIKKEVSTAKPKVSVVEPSTPPTTTTIFDDKDLTIAQTMVKMRSEKAKEKGVAIKDVEDPSRPVRLITILQPLPTIDPKDKGKGVLVEEEPVKIKRRDQGIAHIESDVELAHRLHKEELAEIARIQEEKAAQEEASKDAIADMFDEVQADIDVDALFAAKLQQEEREEYTIEERAKFLAETIAP